MKKIGIFILSILMFVSCKNDTKQTEQTYKDDDLTLLKGHFVYYDGAAVLQTSTKIYGVFLSGNLEELNKQAEKFKKRKTDNVLVEIRGLVSQKQDQKILWKDKVEIVEILSVKPIKQINEGPI